MKEVRNEIETIASDASYNKSHVEELINKLDTYRLYDAITWNIDEVKHIDKSLSMVADKSFAANLYQILSQQPESEAGEALKLVKFLFELKYLKDKLKSMNKIQYLLSQYPENQIYAYFFIKMVYDSEEYDLELLLASQKAGCTLVMKCTAGNARHTYVVIAINLSVRLFYKYIALHDFISARKLIAELDNVKPFTEDLQFNNVLAGLPYTLEQNEALYNLNKTSLKKMEDKVKQLGEDNNKKSFEMLIVFTAVITFLVTAAGATTSESTSIAGLAALGLTLLVFVVASLICLERPKTLLKDTRMIVLILALLSTLAMALVDKYDKFELWAEKSVYIEFPLEKPEINKVVQVPFRIE